MSQASKAGPRRRTLVKYLAGMGASSLLAGCGGGDGADDLEGDATPQAALADRRAPTLVSVTPAAGATGVPRASKVTLQFSETVGPRSAVRLAGPQGTVDAGVTASGSSLVIHPRRKLRFDTRYRVVASNRLADAAGNHFAGEITTFRTARRNPRLALGAHLMDTYVRRRWTPPEQHPWDVLPTLYDSGFEWVRIGVTTQTFPELRRTSDWHTLPWRSEYWSCLEVSGALLQEAAAQGLRLQAQMFLSHTAANATDQLLPPQWEGLSDAQIAYRLERHATNVATYYKSLGLDIEVFEIGNETDFGVCGIRLGQTVPVPPGVDPVNDPAWMRENIWVRGSKYFKAAIRGVLSVYPDAKILLHICGFAYSRDDIAATGFFQSMVDLGVPFDLIGLSFPYQYGGQVVPQPYFEDPGFLATLKKLAAFGRPLQIVEFGYPAEPTGATIAPSPRYPYTPDGQAAFVRDFARAVEGRVAAIHYFYPDWYEGYDPNMPELEGLGLFSAPGVPRPALRIFERIADAQLLA